MIPNVNSVNHHKICSYFSAYPTNFLFSASYKKNVNKPQSHKCTACTACAESNKSVNVVIERIITK